MKSLTPSERRKELLLAKMKREELEKQHLIKMERKPQEIKFEIDRKEQ